MRLVPAYMTCTLLLACLLAGLLLVHPRLAARDYAQRMHVRTDVVAAYGLTDLCLFTEARYTRHPTQADLFAPFQNFPGALDAFPSGSFIAPPDHVRSHGHAHP